VTPYVGRIFRALKLEPALFEEVGADKHASGEAVGIVLSACAAAGVGGIVEGSIGSLAIIFFAILIGWWAWVYVTYFIGGKLLSTDATNTTTGKIIRTSGFAAAPGLITVLGVIPALYVPIMAFALLWMLAAMVISVRQSLEFKSTWRALGVCAIGWIFLAAYISGIVHFLKS
jgi:hypothetical protein